MAFLQRVSEGLKKARLERALVRKSFARFVTESSTDLSAKQIPVFCFHAVGEEFEALLTHLDRNGYRTLTADELVEAVSGRKTFSKPVVLTFDDGWRSTWTVAHPLLKRFGFHGISFLVPTWMNEEQPSPTIENAAGLSRRDVLQLERATPYLSWSEAELMQDDGVFEFQSHSMTHDTVFTSNEIIDFVNPSFHRVPHKIPLVPGVSTDPWQRSQSLGMPLYTVAPRLTGATRYLHNEQLQKECIRLVQEKGGELFFQEPSWPKKLFERTSATQLDDEYESSEQRNDAIRWELKESKDTIEARLGRPVRHFCFPFYAGSELASQLSAELGYVSNYWGWAPPNNDRTPDYGRNHLYTAIDDTDYSTGDLLAGRRCNRVGDDPFRIVRLPGDYVHRLPGDGRRSLASMFLRKCVKNLRIRK